MKKEGTKEMILKEALTLFSERGYDAVSVMQIADAVGIKAPSLYKHFAGKQDIFDGILAEMEQRYGEQTASMQMNGENAALDVEVFLGIREELLIQMGKDLFCYFLHDDFVCKFRKMLSIERYHSKPLCDWYGKQYIWDPLAYQSTLFSLLVQKGAFREADPQVMAMHFYAPMYLLLNLCDGNPEQEPEALGMIEQHIRAFDRLYRKEEV